MSVKIRLSRVGKKHAPVHRIVAVDSRRSRDGKFLEDLGTYDPLKHEVVRFNEEALKRWISEGAQPSDTVKRLYAQFKKAQKSAEKAPTVAAKKPAKKVAEKAVEKEPMKSSEKKEAASE